MRRVCVACGSNDGARPSYAAAARDLGAELARRDIGLVYGGARVGLMGMLADATREAGGHVTGVITKDLAAKVGHAELPDMEIVATMHERKQRFSDIADGYIALPGGFGTFEELLEAITWNQLGIHRRPTGLLNISGFYDPLLSFMRHAVDEGFIKEDHFDSVIVDVHPATLIDRMLSHDVPIVEKWIR